MIRTRGHWYFSKEFLTQAVVQEGPLCGLWPFARFSPSARFHQHLKFVGFSPLRGASVGLPTWEHLTSVGFWSDLILLLLNSRFRLVIPCQGYPWYHCYPLVREKWVPGTIWMKSPFAGSVRQP